MTPGHSGPRLRLLGSFELRYGETPLTVSATGQRVLALLALHDRPMLRTALAGRLWPDLPEARGAGNVRSAVWRLPAPVGRPLVLGVGTTVQIHPDIDVDVRAATARCLRLCSARSVAGSVDGADPDPMAGETDGLTEDLLPDWNEEWLDGSRERYRQLRLHALEVLCQRLREAGRFGSALHAGLGAVAAEPLRESAHRAVIEVHLAEGNVGEALRQYQTCRHALVTELGVSPTRALDDLVFPRSA